VGVVLVGRRVFLQTMVGSLLLAGSLAAEAQPPKSTVRIGFLGIFPTSIREEAFLQGLHDFGYVEGQNITIERRYFEGMPERLPDLATQLVRLKVDVIVVDACGSPTSPISGPRRAGCTWP
jgi:putative tryptophan/tyrosine transport system substrate-binding protein